jgi:hypothetical protein
LSILRNIIDGVITKITGASVFGSNECIFTKTCRRFRDIFMSHETAKEVGEPDEFIKEKAARHCRRHPEDKVTPEELAVLYWTDESCTAEKGQLFSHKSISVDEETKNSFA